jgi:hypothetical protein
METCLLVRLGREKPATYLRNIYFDIEPHAFDSGYSN